MKLIQCDRCGKTVSANSLPPVPERPIHAPKFHHITKLYRLNNYGNPREVDFCYECQELANEVMSRFMLATLKEEVNGRDNERKDGGVGEEA